MQSRNDMKKRVTFSVRTEIKNLSDEVMRDHSLNTDPLLNQMQALRSSLKSVRKHSERVPVLTAFNNEHLKNNDSIVAQLMRLSFNSYLVQLKPLLRSDKQLRKMVNALSKAISNEIDKQRLVFSQEQQDIINSIQESLEVLREDEGSVYSQTTRRSVRSSFSTRPHEDEKKEEAPLTPYRKNKGTHDIIQPEVISEEERQSIDAPKSPPTSPVLNAEEKRNDLHSSDQTLGQHSPVSDELSVDIATEPSQDSSFSSPQALFSRNHQNQSPASKDENDLEERLLAGNDQEQDESARQKTCLDICTIS